MRTIQGAAAGIALTWLAASAAVAQEVQVALDEAGRIEQIDGRLARQLGVFADQYENVQEVRLYQLSATEFVLEITRIEAGRTVRDREPLTADEVAELRRRISERIAERAPAAGLDQEGRHTLMRTTTALGLGFYGWALPTILDVDEPQLATSLYLLTAGSSFFLPWQLTRHHPVTAGQAELGRYGGTRGILHGLAVHGLLAGDGRSHRSQMAMAMLGSVGAGAAGYAFADFRRLTAGDAFALGAAGDMGMFQGFGLAVLLDDDHTRLVSSLALAGAGIGLAGGHRLAMYRDYSWGDVLVMYTAGVLGAYAGVTVADWTGTNDGKVFMGAAMAGNIAGAVLGDRLVLGSDFSRGQSILVSLGTTAGGLMGLGFAYMLDQSDDATIYLTSSALGAATGFAAMYASLAPQATRHGVRGRRSDLRIDVSPAGMLGLARGDPTVGAAGPMPLLNVQYRF